MLKGTINSLGKPPNMLLTFLGHGTVMIFTEFYFSKLECSVLPATISGLQDPRFELNKF